MSGGARVRSQQEGAVNVCDVLRVLYRLINSGERGEHWRTCYNKDLGQAQLARTSLTLFQFIYIPRWIGARPSKAI